MTPRTPRATSGDSYGGERATSAALTRLPAPIPANQNAELGDAAKRTLHADAELCVQLMIALGIDRPKVTQPQYTAGLAS